MILHSTNIGEARRLQVGARSMLSAIGKRAVAGPVAVSTMGLAGDECADLSVHGGLDKAVYAYPLEHYAYWQAQRVAQAVSLFDEALPPGFMGENLTLGGLLEHEVWVGDTLHFAQCTLRVAAPRQPCGKFVAVMGYPQAARDMLHTRRCGFYLSVLRAGTLQAGEAFTLQAGSHGLCIADALVS